MAYQTPLGANPTHTADPESHRTAGTIAAKLIELIELQVQLVQAEFGELRARTVWALIAGIFAGGLVLAALPTLVIGLGFYLSTRFEISTAAGMLSAGLAALLLATISAGLGWWKLRSQAAFVRSRAELAESIELLKQTLSSRHTTHTD